MSSAISIYRGDTTERLVTLKMRNADKSLTDFDLSNVARVDMEVKDGNKVLLTLSTSNNSIEIKGSSLLLKFAPTLTENAKWVQGRYDIQLTYNDGRIFTPVENSPFKLRHDITGRKS